MSDQHQRGQGFLAKVKGVHHIVSLRVAVGQRGQVESVFDKAQDAGELVLRVNNGLRDDVWRDDEQGHARADAELIEFWRAPRFRVSTFGAIARA